ncbi:hypothetical protein [Candidatus Accumulibacter vicinus]|uniref:SH3 domain-containing protein n=1 Tax=Candidatus Accumulibacter vicinus TaxID=2954382 RepID=A0A084Y089_9PROT|nr:hypothetical protein [Candidatus Accumulibacter vicinus]KFB68133.1 MAG: hypothetical protein CAPSK01_001985 [Candidatus Accumulibacter vicinus]
MSILRSFAGLILASVAGSMSANPAAGAASLIVSRTDAGVTVQSAQGSARPAQVGSVLNVGERLCFLHRGATVWLRRSDRGSDFAHTAQQAGCWKGAEIEAAQHGPGSRSQERIALLRLLAALTTVGQNKHAPLTAAARGGQIGNALCKVAAHTDWLVIDQLGGVIVPIAPGAGGRLTLLNARGDAAGASITLEEKAAELRLPAVGAPGQVFELAIRGGPEESCRLRLRIVDGAQHAAQAPRAGVAVDPKKVAWRTAIQALRLVDGHGRAWTLEALRQLAPHRTVPEADQAYAYLAAANRECANSDGSNIPVAFDMPWLHASKSLLSEGRRRIFVVWHGGLPPFRVSLQREGTTTPLTESSDLKVCEAFLPASNLTSGRHVLTITDQAGARLVAEQIDVVPSAQRPSAPALPAASAQPAWLSAAQWMAEQEDGAWRFEALQDVAARLGDTPEAQAWIQRNGRPPALLEIEP